MTETKFTPGPWYCGSDVSVLCDAPSGDLNSDVVNLVALVYSRRSPISGANVVETNLHANRSLIAAAPDLYAALQAMSEMYSFAWDTVDGGLLMMSGGVERFEAAHELARAALAKARGEGV